MPYSASDATRFTKKAKSAKQKRQFAHVANSALKRGASEGSAIRQASAAVAGTARRKKMPAGIGYSSGHGKSGTGHGRSGGGMMSKGKGKQRLDSPFAAAGTVAKAPGSKAPKKRGSDKRRA